MDKPVVVYADGFGTYHADIELQEGDTTPDAELKSIARKAIRKALGDAVGTGYRMKLAYVGMTRSITRPGVLFATFKEA